MATLLDKLDEQLNSRLRWPEAITHEELNHASPGTITRILLRVQYDVNSSNNK